MHMAAVALYSRSPPAAAWSTQSSIGSSSTSPHFDVDIHARSAHHHSSATRSVAGGLSGLFSNGRPASQTPGQGSDGLDCGSGMVRSSSVDSLIHLGGTWDGSDNRGGSFSVPTSYSYKKKDRSPVSVLHGPVSRTSHPSSSGAHSAIGWDNPASTTRLPPLDPHIDPRRKGFVVAEESSPMTRSVGFEIGNDGSMADYHSRRERADASAALSVCTSPDDGREDCDGCSIGNNGVLRRAVSSDELFSRADIEPQELHEARKRFARLALGSTGSSLTSRTSNMHLSAGELLMDAQERHKIFFDPEVIKAFDVAEEAHRGQLRRSGGLYLSHCVETAILLANTGADSAVVAAGLLHDILDDSAFDQVQLRALVGEEIAYLVSGVSKLSAFSQLARDNETAGNPEEADRLRTMFLAMVDVRVVLIKLADRLHNLRTLEALPPTKQLRIAKESMEILAPLANRLGIWSWKAEMEDTCFRYLKPRAYEELTSKISGGWKKGVVSSVLELERALRKGGVEFSDICGRPKNLYSIYSKMIRKGRSIREIFDVRGLRLIVKDIDGCFAALEVVHRVWAHNPAALKDYISCPKANGYQSLHTVVCDADGHPMEVQIRTMDMHFQAEYGMAAHWRYKESDSKHSSFVQQKVEWARWVLTWHSEILDTKLRASPPAKDMKSPCPFPFHKDNCSYANGCSVPPQSDDDPLLVIMVKNQNMIVQELPPGSTVADLLIENSSHRDLVSASRKRTSPKLKVKRTYVNHEFVENFQQKLRMGDLVELILEPETTPAMVPLSRRPSELTQAEIVTLSSGARYSGEIFLEFQREQLKRLYLDNTLTERQV